MNWKHDSHNVIPPISFDDLRRQAARDSSSLYGNTFFGTPPPSFLFYLMLHFNFSIISKWWTFFSFFLWIYISKNYISSFATRTIERTSKETSNQQTQFILFFSLVLYFCYMVLQHQISFVSNSIPLWNAEICMQIKGLLILCKHRIMNVGSRCNDVCYPFVCCTIDSAFKTHNYERRE